MQAQTSLEPDLQTILSRLANPVCVEKKLGKGANAQAYALSSHACTGSLGSRAPWPLPRDQVLVTRPCDDASFGDFLKAYQLQQRAHQLHLSPDIYSITREGKLCTAIQERLDQELADRKYTLIPVEIQAQMLQLLEIAAQHGLWHKDVANLKNWMLGSRQEKGEKSLPTSPLYLIDWELGDIVDPRDRLPSELRPPLDAFTQNKKQLTLLQPVQKLLSKGKASNEIFFYMLLQLLTAPNKNHWAVGPIQDAWNKLLGAVPKKSQMAS